MNTVEKLLSDNREIYILQSRKTKKSQVFPFLEAEKLCAKLRARLAKRDEFTRYIGNQMDKEKLG